MAERLQKIIAAAGICSRRKAEELILAGKVKVNGKVVKTLGTKADQFKDRIVVKGVALTEPELLYYSFNKPSMVVTTLSDPEKRSCLGDYLKDMPQGLKPVGRLDYHSEGLLLVTNDGDLISKLTHPRHSAAKIYEVKIKGVIHPSSVEAIISGKIKGGGRRGIVSLVLLRRVNDKSWWEVVLTEGKNRQIRKIFEEINKPVIKLKRIAIGTLQLDNLKPGMFRKLNAEEVHALKSL